MSDIPLFRSEALSARSTQWAGTIVLARPIPMRVAACVSTFSAIGLSLFLYFGEYTRKVQANGQLVPSSGAIKTVTPQFGRILTRKIKEGERVTTGQLMFELSAERTSQGTEIDERIDMSLAARRKIIGEEEVLRSRQLHQRKESLQSKLTMMKAEIVRIEQETLLQAARVLNASKTLARFTTLKQQGFVSELQLAQVENDRNDQLARQQSLERTLLASKRSLLDGLNDADEISSQFHLNAAQSKRNSALLDQEAAEHVGRRHIQVLATATGIATAFTFEPGESAPSGATLATIIPSDSELEAHLLAPSRAIGFVEPGQLVTLRLAAFPYQKFGQVEGKVLRVELSPSSVFNENGAARATTSAQDPLYKIVVKLSQQSVNAYGRKQYYRAGMLVEADIRQERRRLIEWAFDPISSVAKGRSG